ncbi:MAG TPA: nucleotidyltransferase family protein [Bacilli bacterium]
MENGSRLDVSLLPEELKLLCALIGLPNDPDLPGRILQSGKGVRWHYFLALSGHHRVHPIVYGNLKQYKKEHLVPGHVRKSLEVNYRRNIFHMLRLSRETAILSKAFAEKRVGTLFLKGPVLAREIYGDISLRTSKDLDMLVRKQDIKLAEETLLQAGYNLEHYPFNDKNSRRHHLSFMHPEKHIQVELHWRLNPDTWSEPPFEHLWERKRLSCFGNGPVYFLGADDLFCFLAAHGARHGWFRLRWLADVDQLFRNGMNVESALRLQHEYGFRHIAGQAAILAANLFNTPIAAGMTPLLEGAKSVRLSKRAIHFIKNDKEPAASAGFMFYQLLIRSNSQKVRYLTSYVYPTAKDLQMLPLPKSWVFLYIPLRPFLLLWRKIKQFVVSWSC